MDDYDRLVEHVLWHLRGGFDNHSVQPSEDLAKKLEHVARSLAKDLYFGYPDFPPGRTLLARIRQIEVQNEKLQSEMASATSSILDELNKGFNRPAITCRMRDDEFPAGIAQLIVAGGPSPQAVERGREQADNFLSTWLEDAAEVTILDPFLFKREKPLQGEAESDAVRQEAEHRHADELLALLGKDKRVNFVYRGNPDKGDGGPQKVTQGIANRIADRLEVLALKATFYVVEDLHDRVWMKLDKKGRWHANVVGTSRGGIGKRPTYILPMGPDDCGEYLNYVCSLMSRAQTSHERPIDFKRKRAKKVSKSGRIRKVGA